MRPRRRARHLLAASRRRAAASLAGLLLGAAAIAGCDDLPGDPTPASRAYDRGITLVSWSANGYAAPEADAALAALAATGANTAVLVMTAYQAEPAGSFIDARHPLTPTAGSVGHALDVCAGLGLRTVLKPHLDLGNGAWRGTIDPTNPGAWFQSYHRFILPWAALAELKGVSQFVIGTELAGTVEHEVEWRRVIAAVRSLYGGELIYAASWDEASRVPFWDALDAVGVNFYAPVATRANAGRFEMLRGWQPWLARLERLHGQTGKRVVIAEVGYRSVDGAAVAPFTAGTGGTLDLEEQADLYAAALEAVADLDWVSGLYWWNWPADGSGGREDRDYTPRGKPAEAVLAGAWGGAP